jgi:gliding motility-associated-like protein
MIKGFKPTLVSLALLISASPLFSQLSVDGTPTPTQLVQNTLLGIGVTASGITYTGNVAARGTFNGTASNIGFNAGVLLSTGTISNAIGPNNDGGALQGTDFPDPGDPDLDLVCSNTTHDAAILEFDFIPQSDTLKFDYVFASEEYLEFVNAGVNDAFGFFISGPGISGPFSGGAENIALIPGTSIPVTIDNVNATSFPAYYFDNEAPPGATVQYDGFTVPLTAIAAVQCGQVYHIKLAIADAGDGVWDSGVFLEAGSFSSQGVIIVPEISYGSSNDSTLYEGCGLACITFIRTSDLAQPDTINVGVTGTALNGLDYNTGVSGTPLPAQLIFPAGVDSIEYCINAVDDGMAEGLENIVLTVITVTPCSIDTTVATVYLIEHSPLVVSVSDTTFCNMGGTATFNVSVAGGVEPYTYSWTGGLPASPTVTVPVTTTTDYIVVVNDACTGSPDPTPADTDTATASVQIVAPIELSAPEDMLVCPEDAVQLMTTISGGATPFTYSWTTVSGSDTVQTPGNANTFLIPNSGGTFQVSVVDACGNTDNDLVTVLVEQSCALNIPNILTPDGTGPAENDFFYVENLNKFPGSSLKIYNRWGTKIYESDNYMNDWNGAGYSEGTYYYVLTVPKSGLVQAKAKPSSIAGGSFTEGASDSDKVFAGFFQLSTLK